MPRNYKIKIPKGKYLLELESDQLMKYYDLSKKHNNTRLLLDFKSDQKLKSVCLTKDKNKKIVIKPITLSNEEGIIPTNVYSVCIKKNQDIDYYDYRLHILINNNKQLNDDIKKIKYNKHEKMEEDVNYMNCNDAKNLFEELYNSTIKEMKNSEPVKQYNLENIIEQLQCNWIKHINDNDKMQSIWKQFKKDINKNIFG